MSSTSSPPRRLERSRDDRFVAGVCGGLAKYTNIDASVIRIVTVIVCCFAGAGILAYVIAALVIPEEGTGTSFWKQNVHFGNQGFGPSSPGTDPTDPHGPIYGDDAR